MADMPQFNIMGLLLGGRGYAANYFSQRDQLEMSKAQQAERLQVAQGLLGDDFGQTANAAYGRAMDNPYDRRAQMGLWGRMFSGPDTMAAMGNSLLDKSTSAIYGREATAFEDTLQKQRIQMTADEELRVDETKRARDTAFRKSLMDQVFGPDGQAAANQAKRNDAAKQLGLLPEGMDILPGPNGEPVFRPASHTPAFREMMSEVQTQQNMLSGLKSLQMMTEQRNGNNGAWETERKLLMMEMKKADDLGALDAGTMEFLESTVPDKWDDAWILNPSMMGQTKERLRVMIARNEGKMQQVADRWMIPAGQMPADRSRGWTGEITKPVPKGPARAAVDRLDERAGELRAKDRARGGPITQERVRRAREDADAAGLSGAAVGGLAPRRQGRGASGGAW